MRGGFGYPGAWRRRWLAALAITAALVLGAHASEAQTISVNSGEHDAFSRLVLDIGAERTWELIEDGRDIRVRVSPEVANFDTSGVFELIPRSRLADLSGGAELVLSLACDCPIEPERYADRYLILDIRDGPPWPATLASNDETAEAADRQAERLAAAARLPDLTSLLTESEPDRTPNAVPEVQSIPTAQTPENVALAPALSPNEAQATVALEDAARIMAEQLARAAASGLLEAAPGRPLSDADPLRQIPLALQEVQSAPPTPNSENHDAELDIATETRESEPHDDFRSGIEPPTLPVRAANAIDVATQTSVAVGPQENRLVCTASNDDAQTWSTGTEFHQGLGALRLALYNERDELVGSAVVALAKHYLHYGFGAEAAFWLRQLEVAPQELLIIAGIVDGQNPEHFPPLDDPVLCSPEEVLWRYLDEALPGHHTEAMAAQLQRAAASLPPHLRDLLGPEIARKLSEDGFGHAAHNIRDMLIRGGRLTPHETMRLDLDLGIAGGANPDDIRTALAEGIRDDGADPASALAQAMAFDRDGGRQASALRITAAESLLREVGVGASTLPLWREVVLAHAQQGDVDRMLGLLDHPAIRQEERNSVLTPLISDRLTAGDTATLFILAHSFGETWTQDGSAAGQARIGAVTHLRRVGLYDAATALFTSHRQLIMPSRPSDEQTEPDPVATAWRQGDWEALNEVGTGIHQDIAGRLLAVGAENDAGTGPGSDPLELTVIAETLEDSRSLRASVESLLSDPNITPLNSQP